MPHVPLGYLVQRLSLSSLLLLFRLALLERKVASTASVEGLVNGGLQEGNGGFELPCHGMSTLFGW